MKAVTTIQVTSEEDKAIVQLKKQLKLPSKKAVVLEGLQALRRILQDQSRRRRLQEASRKVRDDSMTIHKEWAPLSISLKSR